MMPYQLVVMMMLYYFTIRRESYLKHIKQFIIKMKDINKIIYFSELNSIDELRKNIRHDISSVMLSGLASIISNSTLRNQISNRIRNASLYTYTGSGIDSDITVLVDDNGNYIVSGNNEYILIQL